MFHRSTACCLRHAFLTTILSATHLLAPSSLFADEPTDEQVLFFEEHVRPILAAHCYSCHSERSGLTEGGLLLDTRAGWQAGGDSGPVIIPREPTASRLIEAVRQTDPNLQMPPDEQLPPEAIERLEQWIAMGAPDPRFGDSARDPSHNPADPIAGRDHWAFRPFAQVELPSVSDQEWATSPIDRYILATLEANGLKPVPVAERHVLIRRLYIQLIGLPPTTEQLAVVLADDRPNAIELLVDELLSSPQFGERWGRHWLDLARYADSNGLDENFLFREAWRYRNWVIDAMNDDMRYDRFLLEQVAGDLLPYDTIDQRDRQRIASGFLVVGPKVLLGNDERNQRMEVADEQIDTIGRAVLGQTLGCARCHDHKFDPIPTEDYYALAGIFTSTSVMETRYMLGQQRLMEQLVGIGEDGHELDDAYERYWRELPGVKERHKQAMRALELLQASDEDELASLIASNPNAIAQAAGDTNAEAATRIEAQQALINELQQSVSQPPGIPPRAMIPSDVENPSDESIRLAGEFNRLGEQVPRGFLKVITDQTPSIAENQSGRHQLADWLTSLDQGAGHLAARVLANRVWQHLMGTGIVRTVDNFGRTGESPSHPELLDYLAQELIDSGWSIKHLVREITTTKTFALSSQFDSVNAEIDPDNRLRWRANRRRLEPEVLRDTMLMVANELNLNSMDSTVWYLGDQATAVGANKNRRRTDFPCRSVYLPVIRNDLPELFEVFDFADPHATTGKRPQTLVATQGLYFLNDESVIQIAEAMAERLSNDLGHEDISQLVDVMFSELLGQAPTEMERDSIVTFIRRAESGFAEAGDERARIRAVTLACQAMFASSRFQLLE